MEYVPERVRRYWLYQFRLGKEYIIPLLQQWGVRINGAFVLDIGCGQGGVVCAFAEAGARCIGLELKSKRALEAKKLIPCKLEGKIDLIAGDFFALPLNLNGRFPDIILLRDVFEHLSDKGSALRQLKKLMGFDTRLFVAFPPFCSAFGGHQQMLRSFLKYIPYFHVFPEPLWDVVREIARQCDANFPFFKEIERLRANPTLVGRFRRMLKGSGLRVVKERYYLIRPSHHLRYGLPVVHGGILGKIGGIREFVVTGAFFLIARRDG